MNRISSKYFYAFSLTVAALSVTACSTGIEGTRSIKMSKEDRRNAMPTAEDLTASEIVSQPFSQWRQGKRFFVTDDKASLIYDASHSSGDVRAMAGRIITFSGVRFRADAGGRLTGIVEFADSAGTYTYNSGKDETALAQLTGQEMPMLIDLDLVASADSVLSGKMVWTLSPLWYDSDLNNIEGRKFVPVTIRGVAPGNMLFPLVVRFVDDSGVQYSMYMNVAAANGTGAESRTYPSLFSETDPKASYPSVSDENWKLICAGRVALGMTKLECRLALGNPSDVISGHDWDSLLDAWSYKNGTYLQFQDGLLVNFRQ